MKCLQKHTHTFLSPETDVIIVSKVHILTNAFKLKEHKNIYPSFLPVSVQVHTYFTKGEENLHSGKTEMFILDSSKRFL